MLVCGYIIICFFWIALLSTILQNYKIIIYYNYKLPYFLKKAQRVSIYTDFDVSSRLEKVES